MQQHRQFPANHVSVAIECCRWRDNLCALTHKSGRTVHGTCRSRKFFILISLLLGTMERGKLNASEGKEPRRASSPLPFRETKFFCQKFEWNSRKTFEIPSSAGDQFQRSSDFIFQTGDRQVGERKTGGLWQERDRIGRPPRMTQKHWRERQRGGEGLHILLFSFQFICYRGRISLVVICVILNGKTSQRKAVIPFSKIIAPGCYRFGQSGSSWGARPAFSLKQGLFEFYFYINTGL